MRAGDERRIHQDLVAGDRIVDAVAGLAARAERSRDLPARRDDHRRLNRDLPDVIAGRVQEFDNPLDARHVRRGHDAALIVGGRRQILEVDVDRL